MQMSKGKKSSFVEKFGLEEDIALINRGPEPTEKEVVEQLKRELEEKQSEIAQLLNQIQELEKSNLDYIQKNEELRNQSETLVASSTRDYFENINVDEDVSELLQALKKGSDSHSRSLVSHKITEKSYDHLKEIRRYLEDVAQITNLPEGEIWNISVWLTYESLKKLQNNPNIGEFETILRTEKDHSKVLLLLYKALLTQSS